MPDPRLEEIDDRLEPIEEDEAPSDPTTTAFEAFMRGAGDTASFGFSDELSGLGGLLAGDDSARTAGRGVGAPVDDRTEYQRARDEWRDVNEQALEEHPAAFRGGQATGVVGTAALPLSPAARGGSMAARAAAALPSAAAAGYLGGYGSSEAEAGTPEVFFDALGGAELSAALGPVVGEAAYRVGQAPRAFREFAATFAPKVGRRAQRAQIETVHGPDVADMVYKAATDTPEGAATRAAVTRAENPAAQRARQERIAAQERSVKDRYAQLDEQDAAQLAQQQERATQALTDIVEAGDTIRGSQDMATKYRDIAEAIERKYAVPPPAPEPTPTIDPTADTMRPPGPEPTVPGAWPEERAREVLGNRVAMSQIRGRPSPVAAQALRRLEAPVAPVEGLSSAQRAASSALRPSPLPQVPESPGSIRPGPAPEQGATLPPRTAREAQEIARAQTSPSGDRAVDDIDALIADELAVNEEGAARTSLNRVRRALETYRNRLGDPDAQGYLGAKYEALDQLKRAVQKEASNQASRNRGMSQWLDENAAEPLRRLLEDSSVWGEEAAAIQQAENAAWRERLLAASPERALLESNAQVSAQSPYTMGQRANRPAVYRAVEQAAEPSQADRFADFKRMLDAEAGLQTAKTQRLPEGDDLRALAARSQQRGQEIGDILAARRRAVAEAAQRPAARERELEAARALTPDEQADAAAARALTEAEQGLPGAQDITAPLPPQGFMRAAVEALTPQKLGQRAREIGRLEAAAGPQNPRAQKALDAALGRGSAIPPGAAETIGRLPARAAAQDEDLTRKVGSMPSDAVREAQMILHQDPNAFGENTATVKAAIDSGDEETVRLALFNRGSSQPR